MAINGPIPTKEFVINQWAKITIERLIEKIQKMKIGRTGELEKSIQYHIISATGGDISKIEFLHEKYGMYIDMGVGNGMPLGSRRALGDDEFFRKRNSRGQLHHKQRKPKVWYSKTMYSEVIQLSVLMAEHFQLKGIIKLKETFPQTINLNM